jgi:hypothetical protein
MGKLLRHTKPGASEKEAPKDKPKPRHMMCRTCNKVWNVDINKTTPEAEYICPACTYKKRKRRKGERRCQGR